jgi:hypothetical protein
MNIFFTKTGELCGTTNHAVEFNVNHVKPAETGKKNGKIAELGHSDISHAISGSRSVQKFTSVHNFEIYSQPQVMSFGLDRNKKTSCGLVTSDCKRKKEKQEPLVKKKITSQ